MVRGGQSHAETMGIEQKSQGSGQGRWRRGAGLVAKLEAHVGNGVSPESFRGLKKQPMRNSLRRFLQFSAWLNPSWPARSRVQFDWPSDAGSSILRRFMHLSSAPTCWLAGAAGWDPPLGFELTRFP